MKHPVKNAASKFLPFLGLYCLLAFRSFSQSAVTPAATGQYIQKYKTIAEEEMERTGVPAAVSLAQGIIESRSGKGWLVEHSHNHFGIKCKNNWTGQTIRYDDDHKNECFRVYATDDSSWRDHSDFLKNTPRYAFLFRLDPLDYKAWAYGLKKAGYATNKRYAEALISTIEKYHLQQYSEHALALMRNEPSDDFAAMLDKKIRADQSRMNIPVHQRQEAVKTDTTASPYPAGLFRINDRRVLYLSGGTQLIAVAEKYHIRLRKLLRYNELKQDVLTGDMLIYLEKKGKTGAHKTHVVTAGETLREIAQEEGIRMKWLCRRNRITDHTEPLAQKILYLSGYAPEGGIAVKDVASENERGRGFWYALTHLFTQKENSTPGPFPPDRQHKRITREVPRHDAQPSGAAVNTEQHPVYTEKEQVVDPVSQPVRYEVKAGDTLYRISRKYGTNVDQIRAWNHLTGNTIRPGQTLIVSNK